MRIKKAILFFSDFLVFYVSLHLTLNIRYGQAYFLGYWDKLFPLFSATFLVWALIAYGAGFYELNYGKQRFLFLSESIKTMTVFFFIAITLFYFLGRDVAPKRVLVILLIIYGILFFFSRMILYRMLSLYKSKYGFLFVGEKNNLSRLKKEIGNQEHSIYEIENFIDTGRLEKIDILNLSFKQGVIVIYDKSVQKSDGAISKLFQLFRAGQPSLAFNDFIEELSGRVPVDNLAEIWFVEKITLNKRSLYLTSKRILDIVISVFLLIFLAPLALIIAILIKADSKGPIIFKQIRVGKNEKEFLAYKFRSMKVDAEESGPQWAREKDPRITNLGSFIRKSHLDEFPQLMNVLLGNMSLVGQRPERPEFTRKLEKKIPFYVIRNLAKPGITGWAQINFPYGASEKDAREKLEYELYYLKNQSFALDLRILAKTFYLIFKGNGR